MFTEREARDVAHHWGRAWNVHDLDEVASQYAEDVALVSPVAAKLLDSPSGTVTGKEALRAYFTRGLEASPDFAFEPVDTSPFCSHIPANQRGE